MKFWAHSDPGGLAPEVPGAKWQPLSEHLQNAARIARRLAELAAPTYRHFHDLAEWCGLLHDYGKYTDCFQKMILRDGKGPCPHSIHGAVMALETLKAPHVAAVIAGHHAGLPDLGEFRDRVAKNKQESCGLLGRASGDLSEIGALLNGAAPKLEKPGERFDLLTRMLLSCLVDADRLDTAGRAAGSDLLFIGSDRRRKNAGGDGVCFEARGTSAGTFSAHHYCHSFSLDY